MAESITMPKLGFDMREGVLVRWVKNQGDPIKKGDVIAEIETDKATVEVESHVSGIVRKILASPGDSIPVGNAIAVIGSADEVIADDKPEGEKRLQAAESTSTLPSASVLHETYTVQSASAVEGGRVKASPLARKVASSQKVDLSRVQGTGPAGRIVRKDVLAALGQLKDNSNSPAESKVSGKAIASVSITPGSSTALGQDKLIQTSKLRQAIGRRLVESKQSIPHFYVSHEYKMDALLDLRRQINEKLPEGEKLSVNDFVVRAAACALQEYPNLNSSMHANEIVQHAAINVGVAVTVPGGLMTIVVSDTIFKSVRQISSEIKAMASRARDGKVKPEDVDGSTFSTSNLGMYDVENFNAIINPPEAAILAIGSSREVPVVDNGQIKIGQRMKCTVSVDHRISDGAEAAQFMQSLAKYLEEPLRLLI